VVEESEKENEREDEDDKIDDDSVRDDEDEKEDDSEVQREVDAERDEKSKEDGRKEDETEECFDRAGEDDAAATGPAQREEKVKHQKTRVNRLCVGVCDLGQGETE
jgi:hypothetical protein